MQQTTHNYSWQKVRNIWYFVISVTGLNNQQVHFIQFLLVEDVTFIRCNFFLIFCKLGVKPGVIKSISWWGILSRYQMEIPNI